MKKGIKKSNVILFGALVDVILCIIGSIWAVQYNFPSSTAIFAVTVCMGYVYAHTTVWRHARWWFRFLPAILVLCLSNPIMGEFGFVCGEKVQYVVLLVALATYLSVVEPIFRTTEEKVSKEKTFIIEQTITEKKKAS